MTSLNQLVPDIKEMTTRLFIPYDVLSDNELKFSKLMDLPTFKINNSIFIKRLTLIINNLHCLI